MGLDMHLGVEKYISGCSHDKEEEKEKFNEILRLVGLDGVKCEESPFLTIRMNIAYWRKANHIHNWFVKQCQEGIDECQHTYIEREKLEELRRTCYEVLADNSKAKKLLPTESGFFFGSTEIEEWYFDALKDTIKQLDSILNNEKLKDNDFYYRANW
jgi:hypothetical protein